MTIRFGAAYYAEYHRADIEADLDLMAAAGFTVIRVGESVWSTWEPEEGVFDLEWLHPVLEGAHRRGIGVILGTPTYAVPMWLTRLYPEIAAETASRHRVGWGARQEVNFAHAAYRFHAERVIRKVVERHGDHPAVIGFQVDNEPGLRLLYNTDVFERFTDWLRRRYGTVERLNQEWGLVYWSHRLSRWDDLWQPDGNFQPQYDLAWRRFQTEMVTEFIGWQADIVREVTGDHGFVTTCISYEQPGVDDVGLSARLDVASGNAYYEMQDSLSHPTDQPRSTGPLGWVVRGPWAVANLADLMYSSKQAPFLVTETNAGSIGYSSMNDSPYDGQWRQMAWLLVARGARLVEYWHWHTLPFGAETYWGGVLPHSGIPGRAYREIARIGAELNEVGDAFTDATPDYDIAVLYDSDSKFALATQGPVRGEGLGHVDPDSYRHIVAAFSRGIFDAKLQQRLVRRQQLHDVDPVRFPVLVVPALYTATDDDLDQLAAYARAGGHLVVGPRTGYGDIEGRARCEQAPARLSAAAGTWYEESVVAGRAGPCRGDPGWFGDHLGRRPRPRRCRGTGHLRAPAPGPLGSRHHPSGRRRADHGRRDGPGPGARRRHRPLAGSVARRRLDDGCLGDGGNQWHHGGPPSRRPQLGLGAGRCNPGHRRQGPAHRRELPAGGDHAARAVGRPNSLQRRLTPTVAPDPPEIGGGHLA